MYEGSFTQSINDTCSDQITTIQGLLLASVPEFAGGLLVAVVAWSVRKLRKRHEVITRSDQQP